MAWARESWQNYNCRISMTKGNKRIVEEFQWAASIDGVAEPRGLKPDQRLVAISICKQSCLGKECVIPHSPQCHCNEEICDRRERKEVAHMVELNLRHLWQVGENTEVNRVGHCPEGSVSKMFCFAFAFYFFISFLGRDYKFEGQTWKNWEMSGIGDMKLSKNQWKLCYKNKIG